MAQTGCDFAFDPEADSLIQAENATHQRGPAGPRVREHQ
jgi:hypothetical protein